MAQQQIEVLMVEDDPSDVDLTREALKEGKVLVNLNVVDNGEKALAFLRKEPPYEKAVKPDLVLLDLNLPRLDGRQVLERMRKDESLKAMPVVVLTTSAAEQDVLRSYRVGANCYITKPVGFEQFVEVVRKIDEFWFTVVRLPPKD